MIDWICGVCSNVIRGRFRPPAYCPRCGIGKFEPTGADWGSAPGGAVQFPPEPTAPGPGTPAPSADIQMRRSGVTSDADAEPRPERRRAKRVRPREPLGVRLGHIAPLEALEVSAIGLLVEHATAFRPGAVCDLELWRSDQTIRLRGEVVRSFVSGGGGSDTRIRYCAAVQFLETPQTIFALVPELSEES